MITRASYLLHTLARLILAGIVIAVAHGQNPAADIPAQAGLEQKLNAQVSLALPFRDEMGRTVSLGDYFGKRPVVLVLAYYQCPNLCTLVLNAMLTSVQDLKLDAGKDFEIVVVSFDPRETPQLAKAKKRAYTQRYGRPLAADGWHFLTGHKAAIESLAQSVGYRYAFDPKARQYAHPSAIMVLTPEGRISRYFAGIEYPPVELRRALVEASEHRVGSLTDQLFLLCFHYDPATGKYGLAILRILRFACLATVSVLAVYLAAMFRRDRRQLLPERIGP